MNFYYYLPIIVVILSNIVYHNATKNTPQNVNSFLSLTVTYFVGCIISLALYFILRKNIDVLSDFKQLNWTSYFLGLAIVGLEVGYIYMYRLGWQISKGSLVANILVALALIILGIFFYKESLSIRNFIGLGLCIVGIILVGK